LLVGWLAASNGLLGGITGGKAQSADEGQNITGNGRQVFDLGRPLHDVPWVGYVPSPPAKFASQAKTLETNSESFQLLRIGNYDGRPGTFEVTIRQSPWHGNVGLFFGLRNQPGYDFPQLTTFQLVWLKHYFLANARGERFGQQMEVWRQRAVIGNNPVHLNEEAAMALPLQLPDKSEVRLRVEFSEQGCERIWVDDRQFPALTLEPMNEKYGIADIQGGWGLYSARTFGPAQSTWFSNLSFTPAE
jgi:hypothetical protein